MQPFARTLATFPNVPREWITGVQNLGLDDRVPISRANEMLSIAITVTGDPYLALKAGRASTPGDAGALDYVMASSATVREAFEVASRYVRLVNDALEMHLVVDGEHAELRLSSAIAATPDVEDYGLSSFFNNCVRPLLGTPAELEVRMVRPAPNDDAEHVLTFSGATVRFNASWSGFRFAQSRLSQPVPTADPNLNQILRVHLDRTLAELPNALSLIDRARHLIRRDLPRGRATAPLIARELAMSRRTLCRRLEEDSTTFSDLLDDVRRSLAIEHVAQGTLSLSEIAFLLGFAQAAGFHRAFKRWTQQTPSEYRDRHR